MTSKSRGPTSSKNWRKFWRGCLVVDSKHVHDDPSRSRGAPGPDWHQRPQFDDQAAAKPQSVGGRRVTRPHPPHGKQSTIEVSQYVIIFSFHRVFLNGVSKILCSSKGTNSSECNGIKIFSLNAIRMRAEISMLRHLGRSDHSQFDFVASSYLKLGCVSRAEAGGFIHQLEVDPEFVGGAGKTLFEGLCASRLVSLEPIIIPHSAASASPKSTHCCRCLLQLFQFETYLLRLRHRPDIRTMKLPTCSVWLSLLGFIQHVHCTCDVTGINDPVLASIWRNLTRM